MSEPALPFGQPHLGAATATFVAQGLTLLPERLRALERWWKTTSWVPGPESDTWGRAWESRRWPENGPGSDNLLSWIVWEQNLLRGQAEPPPSQDGFWELWNSVPTVGSQRWVTCPFQWSIGTDTGWALLKAAIEPWRSEIHYWTVVAAPAHHPVRLSARKQNPGWIVQLQLLGLEDYQKAVSSWRDWTKGILAESPELSLELAGPTTPTLAAEVVFRQTGGVDEVR